MSRDHGASGPGPQAKTDAPAKPECRHRDTINNDSSNMKHNKDRPHKSHAGTNGTNGASNASRRLADLPEDILEQVFKTLAESTPGDLCSVSLVNKRWHDVADSVLYEDVRFEKPEHHLTFGESLTRRERRGSAIQFASLEYPTSELSHLSLNGHIANSHYTPAHFDSLVRTISTMSNLQELEVSVPVNLLDGIGALFNGPFDLAYLKSCSLFYQCPDNAYWDLRDNIHIFAHPTLETLIIRRAKLDYRGFDFIERPHELPLKKLHLIECDISDDALGDVLELPKAMEEFVMTQSPEPTPELEESSDNMGDYIVALRSQCESLKSITIDFPTMGSRRSLRMRDFTALKVLRINWDWQLFGRKSKKPRLDSFGIPPNLEKLEFFNELGTDDEVAELLDYLIQTSDVAAKAVKTTTLAKSVNAKLANQRPMLPRNRRDSYTITIA
ncbi:hypothetical protein F5B22DRAFT_638030 [Xylaria bambusicola]|uniref:uncharacterized protein n=1 Tax=Xylaria bambusicola TaxID=326684 RepID=UPI0020085892|nr:uncharacterized protein F5B22DRAFT_638030 [Xylaria bambusicola]KAI0509375.1 hypothetical protein F5B22DRAFT_638030 [Xylaria bambusicola]